MKIVKIFLFTLLLLPMFSCKEIGPVITSLAPGTPTQVNTRNRVVLIEEFSGVRCVNCPAGSQDLERLSASYPGRVAIVSIHAGFFSNPYPESRFDFRTPEGNALLNLLGQPLGYPSAVINRRKFEGEVDLQLGRAQWPGFIEQELAKAPAYDIRLSPAFSTSTRELRADVDIVRLDNNANFQDLRLSVFIVENNIADAQLTPEGKREDYSHKYVLRKALTAFDGTPLGTELQAAASIRRSYVFTFPAAWRAESCRLIAFVHRSGESWEVLQAVEKTF
ncbi:MAG: hypothetical protein RL386_521 [Bacteroidota bacterium]|jgi:hypothetical protein